jgi:undecaprenyl phosphate-alpha-L-ara4N flippase subunit ArnE
MCAVSRRAAAIADRVLAGANRRYPTGTVGVAFARRIAAMLTTSLIAVVTVCMVISQLLLKRAVADIGAPASLADLRAFFLGAALSPWMLAAVALQLTGFGLWLLVLAREKLGVAVAVSGSAFYVLTALLAWAVYDERLTAWQWFAVGLITVGVLMLLASHA